MSPRTLALSAVGVGLGVFSIIWSPAPPKAILGTIELPDDAGYPPGGPPGEEPDEDPQFDVQVNVDTSGGKNRLLLHITEAHGFYADRLALRIWWHEVGQTIECEESPHCFTHFLNSYIRSGETIKECIELTDPEIANAGGDIGTGDNWSAAAEHWVVVRKVDPEPLRARDQVGMGCG